MVQESSSHHSVDFVGCSIVVEEGRLTSYVRNPNVTITGGRVEHKYKKTRWPERFGAQGEHAIMGTMIGAMKRVRRVTTELWAENSGVLCLIVEWLEKGFRRKLIRAALWGS